MNKRAVYPGSFDPITLGHVDLIERMSKLYDEVVVLVSKAPNKSFMFTPEERKDLIEKTLSHLKNIKVDVHMGLTVDYMKSRKHSVIVRGLRAVVDFEYELTMANMNKTLAPEIETLIMFADPKYNFLSSRGVKEVAQHGGPLKDLVPDLVAQALHQNLKRS